MPRLPTGNPFYAQTSAADRAEAEAFADELCAGKPEQWVADNRGGMVRHLAVANMQKREATEWRSKATAGRFITDIAIAMGRAA